MVGKKKLGWVPSPVRVANESRLGSLPFIRFLANSAKRNFFWGGWILKCISARFRFDRSNCMSHFNCNQLYGLWNYPIHAWISSCSGNSFWSWGTRPAWRCPVPFLMPALPARRMQRVDSTPKVEVSTSCTPQLFLRPPPDLGWVLQDS